MKNKKKGFLSKTTKNQKISICGTNINPGEKAHLALPLPEEYSCSPLYMPIKVVNGTKKGPCILMFSLLRGIELNGLEIINRAFDSIDPSEVSGTIIAIPVMNVYGMINYPSMLPGEHNLANCFPGKETGSYGERMAHIITNEILKKIDYCIEIQTGDVNHNILPQVYCDLNDQESKKLSKTFMSPVVTNVGRDENNLRTTFEDLGISYFVYQAGEALRFDETAIKVGISGICNLMKEINLLKGEPTRDFSPLFSRDNDWILAHKSGILQTEVALGQTIKKGAVIGYIKDPFGAEDRSKVLSPLEGVVVGMNTAPLLHEGLRIFKVCSFLDQEKAESKIEEWDSNQEDSFIH